MVFRGARLDQGCQPQAAHGFAGSRCELRHSSEGDVDSVIKLFGHLFAPEDRGLCLVTVDGGVVTSIEPAGEPVEGSLGGKTSRILPGLIDVQVNGAFGDDFADPSADMDRICKGMLAFGVTGFVPDRGHVPGRRIPAGTGAPAPLASAGRGPRSRCPHRGPVHQPGLPRHAQPRADSPAQRRRSRPMGRGRRHSIRDPGSGASRCDRPDHIPGQAGCAGIDGSHQRHLERRRARPSHRARPWPPTCSTPCGRSRIAIRASSGSSWPPTLLPASSPTATTSPSRRSG